MSTALTTASDNPVSNVGDDPFGAQGSEGASGNIQYMKFTGATGQYTFGQDDEVMEHGTRMVANMMESQWIWTFWWDNEVMEQISDRLVDNPMSYDNPPMELPEDPKGEIDMPIEEIMQAQKDDPGNFRDGWSVQASLDLRPMDGSDDQYVIKLNQGVAMNAFHTLRKSYGRQYKFKQGLLPVIELDVNSYKPRARTAGNKRYAPTLKIVDWVSEEELAGISGGDAADYEDQVNETPQEAESPDTTASEVETTTARRGRRGARGRDLG